MKVRPMSLECCGGGSRPSALEAFSQGKQSPKPILQYESNSANIEISVFDSAHLHELFSEERFQTDVMEIRQSTLEMNRFLQYIKTACGS